MRGRRVLSEIGKSWYRQPGTGWRERPRKSWSEDPRKSSEKLRKDTLSRKLCGRKRAGAQVLWSFFKNHVSE